MVALKEFLRVSQIIAVSAFAVTVLQGPALAQSSNLNQYQYSTDGYEIPIPPVVVPPPVYTPPAPPPPVVVPPPPPVVVAPPEVPRVPVLPVVQAPNVPFFPQAIDLTNAAPNVRPNLPVPIPPLIGSASDGLQTIPNNQFPLAKNLKGKSDWILVRGEESSVFQRPNPYTAKLEAGTILV